MTNTVAKYKCETGDDELVLSCRKTKAGVKVACRHWRAAEDKMATGLVQYFDQGQEAEAIAVFDKHCADAVRVGWTMLAHTSKPTGFDSIPLPPTAKPTPAPKAGGRK